jgi:hypothetical protein
VSCDEDDNTTGCLMGKWQRLCFEHCYFNNYKASDGKTIRTGLTTISAYDRTGEPDGGVLHKETIGITENFK